MDCKNCQYHTKDGRCLYFCGCAYKLMAFEAEALDYRKIDAAPTIIPASGKEET